MNVTVRGLLRFYRPNSYFEKIHIETIFDVISLLVTLSSKQLEHTDYPGSLDDLFEAYLVVLHPSIDYKTNFASQEYPSLHPPNSPRSD